MKIKTMLLCALALSCACAFGENTTGGESLGVAVQKLQTCDFLLNKDFKKDAKVYLCLFSASWCPPCRREMPRIAKTYAETLKDDPNIELIHFSRDSDEGKALAWAKEHDVKFPVVKYNGGNPLDLHTRGIPHLFIVKADGTLIEEGHPMKLFTDEKLRELKVANRSMARATEKTGDAATELFQDSMGIGLEKSLVGYWPFDGNANDETRYRNNGTLHDVTPVEDRHGNANKAYRFNGSSYIEVPHSETLNMTHAITMTAWIKPQSWWANQWIVVMQKGDQRNVNYQFAMRIDDKVFLCGVAQGKCEKLGLELNKWQQVALTYESGKNLCFYRNGALIGKWQCSQDLQPNKGSLLIGYDPFGWTEHFIGDMDDVRLFNRALSEEEIGDLYKAEAPDPNGIPQAVDGTAEQHQATVGGYTWSHRVSNGEAMIVAEEDGKCSCAVSPTPTGQVSIPPTLNGVKVTSIGRDAFRNCMGLTSVTIPEGVTSIGKNAFYNCASLTSVTIPNSVTSIGYGAFCGCTNMTSVTMLSGVTNIGADAFLGCSALTSVMIPNSVTNIGNWAFRRCSNLASVTIPNSVTSIGNGAFAGCANLTSMTIPNSVTSIGNGAFAGCTNLTSMTIPNSVTSIGEVAFACCDRLTSVMIGNGVTSIGYRAFADCTNLKSVTIPNSVTNIGGMAFCGCSSLTSVTIPNGLMNIGTGTFCGCSSLTSVTIPNNVTNIGRSAFSSCSGLANVTIPDSVTSIGDYAFSWCRGLKSVTIPDSVTNIDSRAFDGCKNIASVDVVKEGKVERVSFQDFCKQRKLSGAEGSLRERGLRRVPSGGSLRERRALREQARQEELAKEKELEAKRRAEAAAKEEEREAQRQAEREEQRREFELLKAELKAQKAEVEKARKAREKARETAELD